MEFLELAPELADGVMVTVGLTVASAILAIVIAFTAGPLQLSGHRSIRWAITAYVELFRGTSAIVQLFIFFYVFPVFGIVLQPFEVGVVTLGLNFGAYGSQNVRAALLSVERGQRDAAVALGMGRWQTFRRIVLPQAIPVALPGLGNELVEILKATSIVSLVALTDLTWAGKLLAESSGRSGAVYVAVLLTYFALSLPLVSFARWAERRSRRGIGWSTPEASA